MRAILRGRMQSSRLPGKILLPVLGKPLLIHNVERLAATPEIERVVVATSTEAADDPVVETCRRYGVEVYRGSQDDVLDRIVGCARHYRMDVFCKFTADNPLIDPAVISEVLRFFLAGDYDYASNNHPPTWQDGQEVEVMRLACLEEAWAEAREPFQREHVTPFLWDQPDRYRVGNLAREDDSWYHQYRWTLDYPEDYELIKGVYEALGPHFSTADVMRLLAERPDLAEVNRRHTGYTWYQSHQGQLKTLSTD